MICIKRADGSINLHQQCARDGTHMGPSLVKDGENLLQVYHFLSLTVRCMSCLAEDERRLFAGG